MKKIEGTLVYVHVQEPVEAFHKPNTPKKPPLWQASVVITDKAVRKEFVNFGKSLDTLVSCKEIDIAELEEKYKIPAPEGAGDEVWIVTLRKSTMLGNTGDPVPEKYKPKVFEKQGNVLVDITNTKLVGNGSKGAISFDVFHKKDGTGSIYLKNVLVTDLIEYIKPESADGKPGSEFDDGDEPAEQPKVATKVSAPAKPAAKPARNRGAVSDDDLENLPF